MGGISMSCVATVATGAYIFLGMLNLYKLMNPLWNIDLEVTYPRNATPYAYPLWRREHKKEEDEFSMKVYLSHLSKFSLDFVDHDFDGQEGGSGVDDEDDMIRVPKAVLLWEADSIQLPDISSESATAGSGDDSTHSKSFVITTKQHMERNNGTCPAGIVQAAAALTEDSSNEAMQASFILALADTIRSKVSALFGQDDQNKPAVSEATAALVCSQASSPSKKALMADESLRLLQVDETGPIWSALMNNRTLHLHVALTRRSKSNKNTATSTSPPSQQLMQRKRELSSLSQQNNVLLGSVPIIKRDEPQPNKPTRILAHDLTYLFRRYVLQSIDPSQTPPWSVLSVRNNQNTQVYSLSKEATSRALRQHKDYQKALQDKHTGVKYPYWKPEVAVKLVSDETVLPFDIAARSGWQMVRIRPSAENEHLRFGYLPPLHVDEIGLTSDKYVPLNRTVTEVPLKITLDALSPQRYRLMSHLSQSLDSQRSMGFEASDIDDVRRLISDTNVTLLGITCLASILHLLFEFLTFKSEVEFWRSNKDLTGLSVRALFMDVFCQLIVLAYLVEKGSSLLMTVPAGVGILIAMWKCQKAAGFRLVRVSQVVGGPTPRSLFGWTIVAWRLRQASQSREEREDGGDGKESNGNKVKGEGDKNGGDEKKNSSSKEKKQSGQDLHALTLETDKRAFRTIGTILFPIVAAFAVRSIVVEEHSGWYTWFITSASGTVYALGFVLMTPQLFLNYKLKSVAHLPWKVLCYKFLNTFIDDLFAFIIRMPTMARISCFRDDVVFIIYLFQRWKYPVDTSRPVEGRSNPGQ